MKLVLQIFFAFLSDLEPLSCQQAGLRYIFFHCEGTKSLSVILLFIILLCPQTSFSDWQDTTEVSSYKIRVKNFSNLEIAELGNKKIYADEFLNSYEFGPAFAKREKDSKKRFLDFMIYEKLLAIEGYQKGLDTSEDVQLFLNDIINDLASEQMYRETIWNKIVVDSTTFSKAVEKELIELKISWIFKPTQNEIANQFNLLKNGMSFDSLFYKQFNDSVTYDDRHLETTRFKLEKTNSALAAILDSIKIGKPSQPIKTPDGWYIVRIDNLWKNVIITETQNNELKYSVEEYLRKQKADSVSDAFVNKLLFDNQATIVRTSFNKLKAFIGKKYLSPDKFNEWNLLKNINDAEFNPVNMEGSLNEVLVKTKSTDYTLKNFIDWYSNREPYIKFDFKSHQSLYASLQNIVWRMVRDELLGKIAREKGYDKNPEIEKQKLWWQDKIIYSKMKLELANTINIPDARVKEYYNQNLKKYSGENGKIKPFDEIKKDVWNDCYVFEFTKKMVNKVLSLKEKYKIKINDSALNSLTVLDENNPHTIEVYSIKKGGTIVRPVYPSIDYEWQFWN